MSRNIKYNEAQTLRFEFPTAWKELPTAVDIEVKDRAGTDLVASTAATLTTATALNGALSRGDVAVIMADDRSWAPGDRFRIAASATGAHDDCKVDYYDSANKTAYLKQGLNWSHATTAVVSALFCTYALDTSADTDTYAVGTKLTLTWDPNTDDNMFSQTAEVVRWVFEVEGLEDSFQIHWADIYRIWQEKRKFAELAREGKRSARVFFETLDKDIDRVVDTEGADLVVIHQMAVIAIQSIGHDHSEFEIELAQKALTDAQLHLKQTVTWWNVDDDESEDDGEKSRTLDSFIVGGRRF